MTHSVSAIYFPAGSHAAFQRIYEGPIALSRQPRATPEEKEVGRARAEEVNTMEPASMKFLYVLCS